MQDKKISYWQLWQVDEQGSERQAESLHILKDLIKKAAHFLHVKVSIPLRLVKKQSYLSALHELGGQCGLGAMGVGDKANINLHLPMLARRKANSEVVLLLPKWPRKFFIVQSSTNTIQTLCDKQILSLFDDFIQFYPIEPRRKNFSWSIFASKIASLFPKRHQVGLGLGMILFLFGALGFISILLSDFGNNNKIAFSGAALICFAAVLYFANLAQGRLAKNLPIAHVWTLNFIYHTIFHLKAQELPKLHIDNIKTLIAKTSKDIKIYFRETYLLVASFLSVFVVLLIVLYINLFLFFILACFVVFIVLSALFLSKNMSYDADQIAAKKPSSMSCSMVFVRASMR